MRKLPERLLLAASVILPVLDPSASSLAGELAAFSGPSSVLGLAEALESSALQVLVYIGGPLLVLVALLLLWNRSLKRVVNRRTRELIDNEERLEHQNRVLAAVRNVNQLIVREKDPARLLGQVCHLLIETGAFHNAWIALTRDGRPVEPFYHAGFNGDFAPMAERLLAPEIPKCASQALATGGLQVRKNTPEECPDCPLANQYEGRAGLSLRLEHAGHVYGWLNLSEPAKFAGCAEEAALLEQLGGDIATALRAITAEKVLVHDRKLLTDVLDAMPEMIWLKDPDGVYLLCNQELANLVDKSKEEIIGGTDYDIFPEEKSDAYRKNDLEAISKGSTRVNEESADYLHAGYSKWIETIKTPVYFASGELLGVLGVGRDISRRRQALEEAREMQDFLDIVVDCSPVPMWIGSPNGTVLRTNRALCTALNLSPQQIVGKYNLLNDGNLKTPEIAAKLDAVFKDKKPVRFELPWSAGAVSNVDFSGGRDLYIDVSAYPLLDRDGQMTHVVVQWVDISARKDAEEALHESQVRLLEAQHIAHIAHWTFDPESGIPWWSEELYRIYDRNPADGPLPYSEHPQLVHPDDWERVDAIFRQATETGDPFDVVFRILRPDGSVRTINSICKPLLDDAGGVVEMRGTVQDITKLKQAEEALRESERQARQMADLITGSDQPVAMGFPDGSLGRVNPAFCELTGYTEEELQAIDWAKDLTPPEWTEKEAEALDELHRTGRPVRYEKEYIRKDGSRVPIELLAHLTRDDVGEPSYYYAFVTDISERKRAEKEREKLEHQLGQAQKMEAVGRLAGGVAHDFNNMLSVILGHAAMLQEDMDSGEPFHEDLEAISRAAERSADLTRQLLAFARKQTVAPKVIDLNHTVTSMTRMLQRLIGEDIDLAWRPGDELWSLKIDPSQVDQVLVNLCVNARDAIADVGKVTIETDNTTFDETFCREHAGFMPGDYVLLAVSDDGCGMSSETLETIFEPFFTTKESVKGTGLGLATVYGIVKQNEGFITVYSEPGQGTTFKVYLPRHDAKAVAPVAETRAKPTGRKHETILVVEDEPAMLRMVTIMLEKEGYTVLSAGTPGEALELARQHGAQIHLVITDVVMPEMNGRELARRLTLAYPDLKRLFMSGYTANVIAHHGVLDEGVNFMEKPFSPKMLAEKVREALDNG